jgi:peptidoglycan/xylan/chitin deacetylase (PgdA/CDA1 family)
LLLLLQVLALTFDDGPWPKNMHGVLDVLKAEQVPATFFINTVTGLKEGPPDFNTKAVQVGCCDCLMPTGIC